MSVLIHVCILDNYFKPGLLEKPEISHFRTEKKKFSSCPPPLLNTIFKKHLAAFVLYIFISY